MHELTIRLFINDTGVGIAHILYIIDIPVTEDPQANLVPNILPAFLRSMSALFFRFIRVREKDATHILNENWPKILRTEF